MPTLMLPPVLADVATALVAMSNVKVDVAMDVTVKAAPADIVTPPMDVVVRISNLSPAVKECDVHANRTSLLSAVVDSAFV
jgi:hypothetical protein